MLIEVMENLKVERVARTVGRGDGIGRSEDDPLLAVGSHGREAVSQSISWGVAVYGRGGQGWKTNAASLPLYHIATLATLGRAVGEWRN